MISQGSVASLITWARSLSSFSLFLFLSLSTHTHTHTHLHTHRHTHTHTPCFSQASIPLSCTRLLSVALLFSHLSFFPLSFAVAHPLSACRIFSLASASATASLCSPSASALVSPLPPLSSQSTHPSAPRPASHPFRDYADRGRGRRPLVCVARPQAPPQPARVPLLRRPRRRRRGGRQRR